jgi:hypothetical protein
MITKFATPFYPDRFMRGNLNFLRNRLNRTFYEFIKGEDQLKRLKISQPGAIQSQNRGEKIAKENKLKSLQNK